MTLPDVTLYQNFQEPGYFSLFIDGDEVCDNYLLHVSELLAMLAEKNIIEFHTETMIHDDPRDPVCDICGYHESECRCRQIHSNECEDNDGQ